MDSIISENQEVVRLKSILVFHSITVVLLSISRLFWAVSLVISLILTVLLIHQLFSSIKRNPIVIYTDDNAIAATDINFPAMTICPSLKLGVEGFNEFNLLQVSKDLESGKLNLNDLSSLQ